MGLLAVVGKTRRTLVGVHCTCMSQAHHMQVTCTSCAHHVVQRMMMPRAALSTFSSPPPLGYIHSTKLRVATGHGHKDNKLVTNTTS